MSDWNPTQRLVEIASERAAERNAQTAREYLAELALLREAVRELDYTNSGYVNPSIPQPRRAELQAALDRAKEAGQ